MEARGANGAASFDGQVLRITRGMFSAQGKGEKVIPLASIGAVQLRKPSFGALLADGAWSVSVLGEAQSSHSQRGRGNARREGKHDENTIVLGSQHVRAFEALTAEINAAKATPPAPVVVQAPAPASPAPAPTDPARDAIVAQLRQLGAMHWNKQVSDEVFISEVHKLLPQL